MSGKAKINYGNIKSLAVRRLGDLEMRVVDAARAFGLTFLHDVLPPNGVAPYVVHGQTIELVYVIKGEMIGRLDGRKLKLREGDYLFIPAGVEHRFEASSSGVESISLFSPPLDMDKPDAKIVFKKGKKARKADK